MMRHPIWLFAAILVPALLLSACSNGEKDETLVGYVETDWIYIAAPQPGWIEESFVEEGAQVEIGDLLFRLDSRKEEVALIEAEARVSQARAEAENTQTGARLPEIRQLQAQLEDAKARLERAASEKERILPLVEQGIESASRGEQVVSAYESAKAGVKAAEEAIASARLPARDGVQAASFAASEAAEAAYVTAQIRLDERTIRAKTAGRVEDVLQKTGEFVPAGKPVLALLPEDGLKVRFYVPEADLTKLAPGVKVNVSPDGAAKTQAIVSFIATEAEFTPPVIYSKDVRDKFVFMVEAKLPADTRLRPGLPVDVDF